MISSWRGMIPDAVTIANLRKKLVGLRICTCKLLLLSDLSCSAKDSMEMITKTLHLITMGEKDIYLKKKKTYETQFFQKLGHLCTLYRTRFFYLVQVFNQTDVIQLL